MQALSQLNNSPVFANFGRGLGGQKFHCLDLPGNGETLLTHQQTNIYEKGPNMHTKDGVSVS
jgi:hypothetical protein